MLRHVAGSVCALFFGIACAQAPRTPESVAGCYAIDRQPWQQFGPMLEDTLVHDPPSVLRLLLAQADTTYAQNRRRLIAPGFRPEWLADTIAPRYVDLATDNYLRFSSWALEPGDILDMEWTNGLTGVRLRLTPGGRSWRGTARPLSDQSPSPTDSAHAQVEARAIPCPTGEPVESLPPPA